MSTICLLEVSQLRTKAVDGRGALQTKIIKKLETKAMTTSSQCNTGRTCFIITHYHKRKRFPSYTRCSENHNNTCAENRKIRGLKFDTLYWRHLAAYRKI